MGKKNNYIYLFLSLRIYLNYFFSTEWLLLGTSLHRANNQKPPPAPSTSSAAPPAAVLYNSIWALGQLENDKRQTTNNKRQHTAHKNKDDNNKTIQSTRRLVVVVALVVAVAAVLSPIDILFNDTSAGQTFFKRFNN